MKLRWKIVWWIVGALVVLIVIAVIAGPPEEETTARAPTTTFSTPTTTTKPKPATTRKPASTTSSASTKQECDTQSAVLSFMLPEVGALFDTLAFQASIEDLVGLQETYSLIKWAMADLPDVTRDVLTVCEAHSPRSALDDARAALRGLESSWADIQRVCRNDLVAFGFEC